MSGSLGDSTATHVAPLQLEGLRLVKLRIVCVVPWKSPVGVPSTVLPPAVCLTGGVSAGEIAGTAHE